MAESPPFPSFPVRDLKLEALTKFAHQDWDFPSTKNPKLEPVLQSLRTNAVRVRFLILLPTQIAGAMALTQRASDLAEYDLTGKLSREPLVPEIAAGVEKHRMEMLETYEQERLKNRGTPEWDKDVGAFHIDAAKSLLGLAEIPLGAMMLVQTFPAHVVSAWTAIETTLGDLWEAALNCHPAILASLKGKATRIGSSSDKSETERRPPRGEDEQKSVPIHLIAMNQFDLRSSMGTVFRRQRRFEFIRLSSIREAYSCAFSDKSSRIDAALQSKTLDALSAVRNAIVHRGGYADAEYVRQSTYLKIPKTALGTPIHLDGQIVAALIGDAFAALKNLFIAVDDWIEQN